jgi:hypothetical protein
MPSFRSSSISAQWFSYTPRGVVPCLTATLAALPTTSPIIPQVFITRTVPRASCVTEMQRPAMNRFSISLE